METLLGRIPPGEPAWLLGFRRVYDDEVRFYAIVESKGERVEGVLWTDLSDADLERLDDFEGVASGLYRRIRVRVHTDPGVLDAWAYAR